MIIAYPTLSLPEGIEPYLISSPGEVDGTGLRLVQSWGCKLSVGLIPDELAKSLRGCDELDVI